MIIAIALLVVALIGAIGVAVAAFSTDLQINGVATVKSTVWDIHFDNLKPVVMTGSDKIKEVKAPTAQKDDKGDESTVIKTFEVELKDSGDTVEYNTRSGYIRPDSNFYLSVFGNERSLTTSSNYSSSKSYHATLTSGSASAQDRNYAYPVRCLAVGK